ncbi:MAG: 4-hydroxy-tetrahydrodipicolinate reductase [Bacteroidota bacterium]
MKIALLGYGKMGKAIEKIALENEHEIVLKIDKDDLLYDIKKADVAIDFSSPESAFDNIKNCIENSVPVISGTTGWLKRYDEIVKICHKKKGTFLYASNFSVGVNLFFKLNKYLAKLMQNKKGYEILMEETHHIHKLDAPSGTAITLAEQILENSDKTNWSIKRPNENELFINVKRKGEVPGTHEISYQSTVDEIKIKHEAFNRGGFALGAIIAAEWIIGRTGVFTMDDVLQIN